jgi:long-chain fatty acid transport protein
MSIAQKFKVALSCCTCLCAISGVAHAAGFQLNEQSAASVGMALAGTGVESDASVQFTNPAGIAALSGFNVLGGGDLYVTSVNFQNKGTTSALGTPVSGGNASADSNAVAPYGYASYQIDDRYTVGIGVYSPFGLATRYDDSSSARYFAEDSVLNAIEINPNIAFRLNDQLSFGAGPTIRYSYGQFSNAIDDGSLGTAAGIRAGLPAATAAALGGPGLNDAQFNASGDDWAVGYKAGILYQPDKATALGVAYHSAIQSTLSGNSTVNNAGVASPLAVAFATSALGPRSTPVTAKVDYPDSVTVSGSRQITSDLKLSADVAWVDWSHFQSLNLQFANGAPTASEVENFTDSYRVAIGGEYKLHPDLTLRTGIAYETSPVGSDASRTPRDPDSDRFWLSGGVGYEFMKNTTFDLGYSHLFAMNGGTFRTSTTAGTLIGAYEDDSADIISMDVAYKF